MSEHDRTRPALIRPILISCLGVDLELALLPHFLRHYERLGVRPADVRLILNSADPASPRLAEAEAILAAHGAPAPVRWIAEYTSGSMWEERRRVQREHAGPRDWVLNADIDEFHDYPAPLGEVLTYCDAKGYNAVQGYLIDRLAEGGWLAPVLLTPGVETQFPLRAEVALAVAGQGEHHDVDGTLKMMAHRGDVLPSRGGHNASGMGTAPRYATGARLAAFARSTQPAFRLGFAFRVHHYKWTDTLRDSLERRLAAAGVSPAGAEYGAKLAAHVARHDGIDLGSVALGGREDRLPWRLRLLEMRGVSMARHLRARLPGR